MQQVILKAGREKSLLRGHPWIFSGAVQKLPFCEPGAIFPIYSAQGKFLAQGYFNPKNSLIGRILSFEEGQIHKTLQSKMEKALALRRTLFDLKKTNAFRLINGEGDGIPGWIVDSYDGHLVMQIHTQGIEKLRDFLTQMLIQTLSPKSIYEKSLSPSRREEGLEPFEGTLYGTTPTQIEILENGLKFLISIPSGQKTGFFLDQRQMRSLIEPFARGRKVLNCFAYSGGFSLYALRAGAEKVISVDSCQKACHLASENGKLNHFEHHEVQQSDVFDFLKNPSCTFDFMILDPPAFAKKRAHLEKAIKAYQNMNEQALRLLPQGSFLLTCSCSHFVDEQLFQKAIFHAALKAKRTVQILSSHIQAPDHPISLAHPEGGYLKSLLLFVD